MPDPTKPPQWMTDEILSAPATKAMLDRIPRRPSAASTMFSVSERFAEAPRDTRRTLCIDFDGVLHSYTSPWAGADVIPDAPVPGAFPFLAAAVLRFRVAVFSARSHQPGGIDAMRRWFAAHALPDYALDALEFPTEKPQAIVYIDDRGWRFDGTWPSLDELAAFQPWNRRKPAP